MKSKVIEQIQQRMPGHTTKAQAAAALEQVLGAIAHVARNEERGAVIPGFGRFKQTLRPSRDVKNPRTGEMTRSVERQVLTFKASKGAE